MLQPSLSGDARISVICTISPDADAVAEHEARLGREHDVVAVTYVFPPLHHRDRAQPASQYAEK